jgi:hypothetical protein
VNRRALIKSMLAMSSAALALKMAVPESAIALVREELAKDLKVEAFSAMPSGIFIPEEKKWATLADVGKVWYSQLLDEATATGLAHPALERMCKQMARAIEADLYGQWEADKPVIVGVPKLRRPYTPLVTEAAGPGLFDARRKSHTHELVAGAKRFAGPLGEEMRVEYLGVEPQPQVVSASP